MAHEFRNGESLVYDNFLFRLNKKNAKLLVEYTGNVQPLDILLQRLLKVTILFVLAAISLIIMPVMRCR